MHLYNPHTSSPATIASLVQAVLTHRQLIIQMIRREVIGRYRGSVFGLTWSLFHPLFMLSIYTFVFAVVFKARWGEAQIDSKAEFALLVFSGMIVLSFFTEAVNRAPTLILTHANYVKKVIFPLEILPIISLGAALFHTLISFLVLLAVLWIFTHQIYLSTVLMPLVIAPLVFFTLGVSWVLAALGVFLRDVGQVVGMLTAVLLFVSPVFYPVSALPPPLQTLMMLNPLTFMIEQTRVVVIAGNLPDWSGLFVYALVSVLVMWAGYAWFQKTRKGFVDVL